MSLAAGTKLGPYEVVGPLGASSPGCGKFFGIKVVGASGFEPPTSWSRTLD